MKEAGQGWARLVNALNLPDFRSYLKVRGRKPQATSNQKKRKHDGVSPFAGQPFKTSKRFTRRKASQRSRGITARPRRRRTAGGITALRDFKRGFWKLLSNFDVSLGSSPGQILIPQKFRRFFPDAVQVKEADAGGKGRQWAVEFPVQFRDGSFAADANGRFIIYEPKSGAPRPNTEGRFTFRNREILLRLKVGDMLVFRFSADRSAADVQRFTEGSRGYGRYRINEAVRGTV